MAFSVMQEMVARHAYDVAAGQIEANFDYGLGPKEVGIAINEGYRRYRLGCAWLQYGVTPRCIDPPDGCDCEIFPCARCIQPTNQT